jgi:PEGA domain
MLPGSYQARWINRSTLEVAYHDSKGQPQTEKIYVLDVYDATPPGKPPQDSSTSAPQASQKEQMPDCKVSVMSTPDGADVEIDGSFVGSTPSTVQLAVGEHSVVIKKTGYETWERKLRVSGGDVKVSAELEAKK